ncbi:MAG: pyruvate ferredoxin oxidoreductase [Firmicutes bacterium]|nr:pyruvate ferredoxin oxidoreductase [Bacillota bacterium]
MLEMIEFRFHGRGGQGIVLAAAVFAEAIFREGLYARAFSLFGAERRGAPVTAFVRAGRERLMPRCRVYRPDYIMVIDPTLTGTAIPAGLKAEGGLLINDRKSEEKTPFLQSLPPGGSFRLYRVDASAIAWKYRLAIGSFPAVNAIMVGALARVSGLASLESVQAAVEKKIALRLEDNLKAAAEGYRQVEEVTALV